MTGSFEDFVAWNAKYNERYKYATDEQREQMVQGWDDTWYEMLGMLRLYWDEVDEVSRTKEGWLALATSTDAFQSLSAEDQQKRLIELQDQYDAMEKAQIDNATFDDQHQMLSKIDELKTWTFNVRLTGIEDYVASSDYSNYVYNRDTNTYEYQPDTDYAGVGKTVSYSYSGGGGGDGGSSESSGSGSSSSSTGTPGSSGIWYVTSSGEIGQVSNKSQLPRTTIYSGSSYSEVAAHRPAQYSNTPATEYKGDSTGYTAGQSATSGFSKQIASIGTTLQEAGSSLKNIFNITTPLQGEKFASGGLVDYTGPAWVDGTKSKPEAFLDATDTAILRGMLDSFDYIRTTPYMTHVEDIHTEKPSVNIGDVNVNLYEAKLENDADYDAIARKVGSAFTKELQKTGMNLASYAW